MSVHWTLIFPALFFAVAIGVPIYFKVTTGKWFPNEPNDGGM